jgi:hypothetical protein
VKTFLFLIQNMFKKADIFTAKKINAIFLSLLFSVSYTAQAWPINEPLEAQTHNNECNYHEVPVIPPISSNETNVIPEIKSTTNFSRAALESSKALSQINKNSLKISSFNETEVNIINKTNSAVVLSKTLVKIDAAKSSNMVAITQSGTVSFMAQEAVSTSSKIASEPELNEVDQNQFIEYLTEQIKMQIAQGNYNGSASGTAQNTIFAELFNNIRSAFRQSVAQALFPQSTFPLPETVNPPTWLNISDDSPLWPSNWTAWPSTWNDTNWSYFTYYLEHLSDETKATLRGRSLYNPDNGSLPEGGYGWQVRNELWAQISASLNLPSGEINFNFQTIIDGKPRTVQVHGTWGQYFRDMFDKDIWEANGKIREVALGGETGNNGGSGTAGEGGNNNNNGGTIGTLIWSVQPASQEPAVVPTTLAPSNGQLPTKPKGKNSSPLFVGALVGPSVVGFGYLAGLIAASGSPATISVGTPVAATVPPSALVPPSPPMSVASEVPSVARPVSYIPDTALPAVPAVVPTKPVFRKGMW